MSVGEELLKLWCKQFKLDLAVFTMMEEGMLIGICSLVDDFLHVGNEKFEEIMSKLQQRFLAGKIEQGDFQYIGFKI